MDSIYWSGLLMSFDFNVSVVWILLFLGLLVNLRDLFRRRLFHVNFRIILQMIVGNCLLLVVSNIVKHIDNQMHFVPDKMMSNINNLQIFCGTFLYLSIILANAERIMALIDLESYEKTSSKGNIMAISLLMFWMSIGKMFLTSMEENGEFFNCLFNLLVPTANIVVGFLFQTTAGVYYNLSQLKETRHDKPLGAKQQISEGMRSCRVMMEITVGIIVSQMLVFGLTFHSHYIADNHLGSNGDWVSHLYALAFILEKAAVVFPLMNQFHLKWYGTPEMPIIPPVVDEKEHYFRMFDEAWR